MAVYVHCAAEQLVSLVGLQRSAAQVGECCALNKRGIGGKVARRNPLLKKTSI